MASLPAKALPMPFARLAPLALLGIACLAQAAPEVRCHVDYGGETRLVRSGPSPTPYTVAPVAIGSYFLFRLVVEAEPRETAAVKLYTYADRDEGAAPIHQASFPYPPTPVVGRYGFTGLQAVYEPLRDGELQYWCELESGK